MSCLLAASSSPHLLQWLAALSRAGKALAAVPGDGATRAEHTLLAAAGPY